MKRGTTDHPKVDELCALLDIKRYEAIGILNTLWDWAGRYVPQGDIGKYSDRVIAKKIDWAGDPSELLSALRDSRWIDEDSTHRLVIHDWPEHCEDSTHSQLARQGLYFADGTQPKLTRLSEKEKAVAAERFNAPKSADIRDEAPKSAAQRTTMPLPLPSHNQTEPLPSPDEDRSLHSRVLCESVGCFDFKDQAGLVKVLDSYSRHSKKSLEESRDYLIAQWNKYGRMSSRLSWVYGSAYKFFMSGKWDNQDSWPWKPGESPPPKRAAPKESAEARAMREVEERNEAERQRKEAIHAIENNTIRLGKAAASG